MERIEAGQVITEPRPKQRLRFPYSTRIILGAAASLMLLLVDVPLARSQAINPDDVIKRAQTAMGGADVKSIHIRGVGPGSLFGQAYEPGFAWPKVIYTSLTRVLDFEREAFREDATRSRAELLGGGATPPFGQGDLLTIGFLKEGVSWNTVGPFIGPAPVLLDARINDLWTTSPHGAILAAKKFGASAETRQLDGQSFSTLSFTIPRRLSAVVWVNSAGFVTRIDSKVPNAMLADMDVVTRFDDYRDVGGLKFPMRLRQSAAGTEVFDISVQDIKIDVPAKIDVPEAIRGAKPKFSVQKTTDGVLVYRRSYAQQRRHRVEGSDRARRKPDVRRICRANLSGSQCAGSRQEGRYRHSDPPSFRPRRGPALRRCTRRHDRGELDGAAIL